MQEFIAISKCNEMYCLQLVIKITINSDRDYNKQYDESGVPHYRRETELILKSRRVVPRKLLEAGFKFKFETWQEAAQNPTKTFTKHRELKTKEI